MKRVFLVETNPALKENITEILELSDYRVIPCTEGGKSFETAQSEQPDLIIYDLMAPVQQVKHFFDSFCSSPICDTPVMLLEGNLVPAAIKKSIAGLKTVSLQKPFTREELLEVAGRMTGIAL